MKKVLWIIFSVLIIIFCLQIGVNCFLLFNKNFLAKKLLKGNYKISGLFYIFPNLIFIHRVNFSSGLYNLNVDNVFLSFNILKMLKRNFVVNSLKTKNVFLEMAQVENLVSGENLLLQDKIQQFFVNLPPKMEFKKINVKYKNEDINIYNLSKRIHRDKIEINIDGAWKKYKFQFSLLTDPTKFEWLLKGKIFLLLPGERADLKLSELFFIETILSGTYDLTKFQKFYISLVTDKKKEQLLSGEFKLYPLEIVGRIDNPILQGKLKGVQENNRFSLVYNGVFKIYNLTKFYTDEIKLSDLHTHFSLDIIENNYEVSLSISQDNFLSIINMYNNNGSFRVKIGNSYIDGNIKYYEDKKLLTVNSNDKNRPLNIKISFLKDNKCLIEGNILDYIIICDLIGNREKLLSRIIINQERQQFKLGFETDYSIFTADLQYKSEDKNIKSKISINETKEVIFDIMTKNFKIDNNFLSCIISGKIKKDKLFPSQRYILTASVKNCFINNINVFDDAEVSGEIIKDKILFKLNSTDNTLKVKSLWQPVEKYIFTEIILKKENVNIGAITTGVYSKIKIMKDKKLNIVGSYTLNNVIYDKKSLAEVIEGKFNLQDKKEIIFEGIVSRRKTAYKYQILLPLQPQKKYGLLKLTGITLLPGFKDENVYNAELTFNSDFIFTGEVMLEGKLYNDTSEIIISSATVLLNKKTLTLATRLKNVEFKNQHIMGNIKIEVLTLENQVIHINSVVSDLWINNYPIEKIMIQAVYNIKKNEIDFIPVKLYGKNDTTVSGKLIILPQNLSFVEYKIYNNSGEMLILIGDIGRKGDLLKINVTKIPIETFTSIIGMSKLDVKGVMDANIEVLSYNPIKSDYRLTSNFIVKNVEIVGMKVERITGRISNDEDSIYFENIDFVFNNAQKVRLLGEYYIKNQNLNFSLSSSKCALSIFNNFYNFIKTADGTLTVDVKIKGTKNLPRLYGYLLIQKGKVQFNKYLKYLDNVNLELKFEGNKVKIERCSGYYEQTKLVISGVYDINNSSEFYIHTEGGNGVFVTLEELSFPVGRFFKIVKGEKTFPSNGNLHFDLNLKKYKSEILATGSIVMNNTYFTYPGISGRGIIKKYNNFFYDITLAANNNVWYENETISANITGKLNFKYLKNMQKSNINGKIEVLRGKVNFLNTPLNIKFGGMEILNRDIYLELEAETDIITTEQEKITVRLVVPKSKIEEIKPKLVSPMYPDLKTEDITALMLGVGKMQKYENKVSVVASENINYLPLLRTQFVKMIDTAFATPIAKNILQKWGIVDNVVISQISSPSQHVNENVEGKLQDNRVVNVVDILKNTKYGVEKYISPDMVIGYSITLAEIQNKLNLKHELEISYRLKNNVFIKGIYNYGYRDYDTNRYSGDVRIQIEPRFKFKSWAEEEKEQQ